MTAAPPPASSGGLARARAWLTAHRLQAGGSAVALVGAFALYRRHQAADSTTTAAGAGTGGLSGTTTGDAYTAGLSGTPDTSSSDIENWVQDQLNGLQANVNAQLANPSAPAAPSTPAAAASVLHPPAGTKWVKDESKGGLIYQIWPTDGSLHYVNMTDYIVLGSPKLLPINTPPPVKGKTAVPLPKKKT